MTALIRRSMPVLFILLCIGTISKAQLKVGDNPTSIQKSSILELESSRQGLLLPRLADTVAINALTPPDGMIIFLNADKSLRLRSNGGWKKIADLSEANANWSLKGNAGTDPSTNFIGTIDGQPLVMRTSNNERLRIDANGNIGIGTNAPTAKLNVNGSVEFDGLGTSTTEVDVLVLAADGSVLKRTMSSSAFENAIKSINGIQRQTLAITADVDANVDTVTIVNRDADSTIAIYLPVQDGSSATNRPYGFLTNADWQKIQSSIQTITIGAVAATGNASGASINITGTSREIILHPATETTPGILTAGTQTIGGDKTFAGNTTIGGTLQLNTVANNTTADSVLVINNGVIEKRQVSDAAFGNAIRNINGNRDTVQTISFTTNGNDLTVSTANNTDIHLNVPNAAVDARGVVSTGSQAFAGTKSFQDSVYANTSMKVGGTTPANSTVQIEGSVSMAIRTITGSGTLTNTDNTVLVNTTSGSITVTLPAPGTIAGRIYTIKKIGTGGIDNELTITPSSGTIDGGANYKIYNDYTYVTLQTDGTNWYIIKK